jgi:hypothetical protein
MDQSTSYLIRRFQSSVRPNRTPRLPVPALAHAAYLARGWRADPSSLAEQTYKVLVIACCCFHLCTATKPAGGYPGSKPPYGHDFHGVRAKPPYHHEEEEEGKEGLEEEGEEEASPP